MVPVVRLTSVMTKFGNLQRSSQVEQVQNGFYVVLTQMTSYNTGGGAFKGENIINSTHATHVTKLVKRTKRYYIKKPDMEMCLCLYST